MELEQETNQPKNNCLSQNQRYSKTNLYELSLVLSEGQSRHKKDRWNCFINNLSRICDEFATSRTRQDDQSPTNYLSDENIDHISLDSLVIRKLWKLDNPNFSNN